MKHAIRYSAFVVIVVLSFIARSSAGDPATKPAPGASDLYHAAASGDLETVKKLLDGGQRPDDTEGLLIDITPLMSAAQNGHIEIMKVLIAHGANVAKEEEFHGNALDYAAMGRHVDAVALVLEKHANLKHKDKHGRTALHHAVMWDGSKKEPQNVEAAKFLIEKGADVNAKEEDGHTPLRCAVQVGNKEAVELLIAKDADVNSKDKDGLTPLYTARRLAKFPHSEVYAAIADILVAHGAEE